MPATEEKYMIDELRRSIKALDIKFEELRGYL